MLFLFLLLLKSISKANIEFLSANHIMFFFVLANLYIRVFFHKKPVKGHSTESFLILL